MSTLTSAWPVQVPPIRETFKSRRRFFPTVCSSLPSKTKKCLDGWQAGRWSRNIGLWLLWSVRSPKSPKQGVQKCLGLFWHGSFRIIFFKGVWWCLDVLGMTHYLYCAVSPNAALSISIVMTQVDVAFLSAFASRVCSLTGTTPVCWIWTSFPSLRCLRWCDAYWGFISPETTDENDERMMNLSASRHVFPRTNFRATWPQLKSSIRMPKVRSAQRFWYESFFLFDLWAKNHQISRYLFLLERKGVE